MRIVLPTGPSGEAAFPCELLKETWLTFDREKRKRMICFETTSGRVYTNMEYQGLLNVGLDPAMVLALEEEEARQREEETRQNGAEGPAGGAGGTRTRPEGNNEGDGNGGVFPDARDIVPDEVIDPGLRNVIANDHSPSPELTPPPSSPPPPHAQSVGMVAMRGALASRGTIRRLGNRKRKQGEEVVITDLMEDPNERGKRDLTENKENLKEDGQRAKLALREVIRNKFRDVAGVEIKGLWPDPATSRRNPETNERYLTPYFSETVTFSKNRTYLKKVTDLVAEDLKTDCPEELDKLRKDRDWTWSRKTIEQFAKDCFNTYKRQWLAQTDQDRKERKEKIERASRWSKRRADKADYLTKSAIPLYKEKFGTDPTPLVREEYMSDEASGPEDDSGVDKITWMRKMADASKMVGKDMSPQELHQKKFHEVIEPEWRSEEVADVYDELRELFWNPKDPKDLQRFKATRVRGTGRTDSNPPKIAPYNFAISDDWYRKYKDLETHRNYVVDYFTYGDPDGFGMRKNVAETE